VTTSRLAIYNGAVRLCGERKLSSVSEDRKSRRLLDGVWDDGGVRLCLEMGQWRFALRTVEIAKTDDFTREFGFSNAFTKPTDLVRLVGLSHDEYFSTPFNQYTDEGDYWFADVDPLYVRYVSDDDEYGMDFAKWPESFNKFAQSYFAHEIVTDLTSDKEKWAIVEKTMRQRLTIARSNDAMKDPAKPLPTGSWVNSRAGRGRSDRGNPGSLTG
jgi:hypothetical protein